METKSAVLGGLSTLIVGAIAFGGFAVANADNQPAPAPSIVVTTEAPAPIQEPAVTTPAPEPTTEAPAPVEAAPVAPVVEEPAPVVVEPAPVYVAPEPVAPAPAPAPVVVAPAPVVVAPAPAPGEYNRVQLEPVNGTTAYAYSTDPNAPVNAPAMPTGNGKRG